MIEREGQTLCLIQEGQSGACIQVVGMEEYKDRTDIKMLMYNQIPGFLPLEIRYVDEKSIYSYSVCGMISLESFLQKKKLDFVMAKHIYWCIKEWFKKGREYLLESNHYVLEPMYMFWDIRKEELNLCYFPGKSAPVGDQIEVLNQYLLQVIDHKDKKGVEFIYGIYELIQQRGFIEAEIEHYIQQFAEDVNKASSNQGNGEIISAKNPMSQRQRKKEDGKKEKTTFYLRNVSEWKELPRRIEIHKTEFTIGRSEKSDFLLPAEQISRQHAKVCIDLSKVYLSDENSTNGVYLNGKKLLRNHPVVCRENDVISFADISYCLERQQEGV